MVKLIVLIGLPASGKSLYAEVIAHKEKAVIISSDKMREELYNDVNNQDKNSELFVEINKRIKENLSKGVSVVYDATNINWKKRRQLLLDVKKYNVYKECLFVATPYELCLKRNNERDRKVPEYVIKKMYKTIYIPQVYEGWDNINITYNGIQDMKFDVNELFNGENGLNKIDQDNPYHTLTIGNHCRECSRLCEEETDDFNLIESALFHDIGKRFTKEFKNTKGEESTEAHYYQHHLVSAYDVLFYLKGLEQDDLLEIVQYITWHMQPFFMETEKAKTKFIKLVGQEFYDKLLILHEADINAK